jgi:hypothetical protein
VTGQIIAICFIFLTLGILAGFTKWWLGAFPVPPLHGFTDTEPYARPRLRQSDLTNFTQVSATSASAAFYLRAADYEFRG